MITNQSKVKIEDFIKHDKSGKAYFHIHPDIKILKKLKCSLILKSKMNVLIKLNFNTENYKITEKRYYHGFNRSKLIKCVVLQLEKGYSSLVLNIESNEKIKKNSYN